MGNKRIIAIDGNSLINRAYYALPPLSTKKGIHTNAVYGFINMMNKIFGEYEPEFAAIAFDLKAPTFRHKEYSDYKAGRKKTPFELLQQFPLLKQVLEAMGIRILELEGFEADDIIGTIVKRAEESGLEPYVITGDKDALQLASDKTRIIITRKGITEFDVYDEKAMLERYEMTPEQFIDLKGLMGDASDNIPGIPGVGEKTGIALIKQFGSVANLVAESEKITKPKLREKVEEFSAQALMSRRLAEINTNVPLEMNFEEFRLDAFDREKTVSLYRELELFSLIPKIDKTWMVKNHNFPAGDGGLLSKDESESGSEKTGNPFGSFEIIMSFETEAFEKAAEEEDSVYLKVFGDGNHVRTPEIFGGAVAFAGKLYYFTDIEKLKQAVKMLADRGIGFKGHLLKNDYYMLKSLFDEDIILKTKYDTGIAQYVLEPQRNDFGYKAIAMMYLGLELEDEKEFYKKNAQADLFGTDNEKFAEYAGRCIGMTMAVEKPQTEQLRLSGMEEVFYDIELPLIEIFADMEHTGFRTDRAVLEAIGQGIDSEVSGIRKRIYELAGEEFNINSPKQLGALLFEKLAIPGGKKTKTGYSTNADILEKLRGDYEIAGKILEYRTLTKLKSTYIDGLIPLISPADSRIRAHFQQTGTATGRISCTEPNLQNIPVRQEQGRTIRKAFIAGEDCVLVDADYSQIELRVMAHISNDRGLIDAFNSGADIHRSTAAKVFEVPEEEVTALQRSNAKAVNFGVIYGMSGFGLSENLNITRKEAEKYIKDYFSKYAGVRLYMDSAVADCRKNGYVSTIKGRRREIPEISASNFMQRQAGERLAMNSPIQGSAADIIKVAMIKVFGELRDREMKSKLVLQVHDELIIDTVKEEETEVKELLRRNMMEAEALAVPLEVGMDSGASWYEVK